MPLKSVAGGRAKSRSSGALKRGHGWRQRLSTFTLTVLLALPLVCAFDPSVAHCYAPDATCTATGDTRAALKADYMCIEDDSSCVDGGLGCDFGGMTSCRRCFSSCDNAQSYVEKGHTTTDVNFCHSGSTLYCDVCSDGTNCPGQTPLPSPTPTHSPVVTHKPSRAPTTGAPTEKPSGQPTFAPTAAGTIGIIPSTSAPSSSRPTATPTRAPTAQATTAASSTSTPTAMPTEAPSSAPTSTPTAMPTEAPSSAPSTTPTAMPTEAPVVSPTPAPSDALTPAPSSENTPAPTLAPSPAPTAPLTPAPSPPAGLEMQGTIQLPAPLKAAAGSGSSSGSGFQESDVQAALGGFFAVDAESVAVQAASGRRRMEGLEWKRRLAADYTFNFTLSYSGTTAEEDAASSLGELDDRAQWEALGAALNVDPLQVMILSLEYPALGDTPAGSLGPTAIPAASSSGGGSGQQPWVWVVAAAGALAVGAGLLLGYVAVKRKRGKAVADRVAPRLHSMDRDDEEGEGGAIGGRPNLKLVQIDLSTPATTRDDDLLLAANGASRSTSLKHGKLVLTPVLLAPAAGDGFPSPIASEAGSARNASRRGYVDEFEGAMLRDTPVGQGASWQWEPDEPNGMSAAPAVVGVSAMSRAIRSLHSAASDLSSPANSARRAGHTRSASGNSNSNYWVGPPPVVETDSELQAEPGLSAAARPTSARSGRARSFVSLPDDAASAVTGGSYAGRRVAAPLSPSSVGAGRAGGGGAAGSSAWGGTSAAGSPARGSVISSQHSSPSNAEGWNRTWLQRRSLDQRIVGRVSEQRHAQSLAPDAAVGSGVAAWDTDPYAHGVEVLRSDVETDVNFEPPPAKGKAFF